MMFRWPDRYGKKGGYTLKKVGLIAMCVVALSVFTFGFVSGQSTDTEINPFCLMDYSAAD